MENSRFLAAHQHLEQRAWNIERNPEVYVSFYFSVIVLWGTKKLNVFSHKHFYLVSPLHPARIERFISLFKIDFFKCIYKMKFHLKSLIILFHVLSWTSGLQSAFCKLFKSYYKCVKLLKPFFDCFGIVRFLSLVQLLLLPKYFVCDQRD